MTLLWFPLINNKVDLDEDDKEREDIQIQVLTSKEVLQELPFVTKKPYSLVL